MFHRALEQAPHAAHVLDNLGYHLMAEGQLSQALTTLERAAAIEPLNAMAAVNIASLRERLGARAAGANQKCISGMQIACYSIAKCIPTISHWLTEHHISGNTFPPLRDSTGLIADMQPIDRSIRYFKKELQVAINSK